MASRFPTPSCNAMWWPRRRSVDTSDANSAASRDIMEAVGAHQAALLRHSKRRHLETANATVPEHVGHVRKAQLLAATGLYCWAATRLC
ncbi:hypothetical protein MRX96_017324 [Rhipicephalus microplus]